MTLFKKLFLCLIVGSFFTATGQTQQNYKISFKNAVHHEATVEAEFLNLENKVLALRMSRTSPGRYALHEFAKNVYDLKAEDSNGKALDITRPNPYQWDIAGHDGTVKISYTLFANRGDGTYSQIDETHAHLNIPATFMYAPDYAHRPIHLEVSLREDLGWKIASQLKSLRPTTLYAPDLDYFMDSPIEISDHASRSFQVNSNGKNQEIRFVLHHQGTDEELDRYFESVKKIVLQEIEVFGELPDFDFGTYTFLACYIPNASGDGMEHRNSTILTSTRSLENGGLELNLGTVSHEFFHAWNVERIRPQTLKPFNYEAANMSGELWFAEGFTSYYTGLILCRAGLKSPDKYIEELSGSLNYVWNSPGRNYFNPIEMSYQAPFVDAARAVDPVNRENTFISYYTYGSVLGLALDLELRQLAPDKNLDGYMQQVWQSYGIGEVAYTVRGLQQALTDYAGNAFSNNFFSKYIYKSEMPDYKSLFASVGVNFQQLNLLESSIGVQFNEFYKLRSNPFDYSAAYNAGLSDGDELISIDDLAIDVNIAVDVFLKQFKPGQKVKVKFKRFGLEKETILTFDANNSFTTSMVEKPSQQIKANRNAWLSIKE